MNGFLVIFFFHSAVTSYNLHHKLQWSFCEFQRPFAMRQPELLFRKRKKPLNINGATVPAFLENDLFCSKPAFWHVWKISQVFCFQSMHTKQPLLNKLLSKADEVLFTVCLFIRNQKNPNHCIKIWITGVASSGERI